jgi:hypothetical protein
LVSKSVITWAEWNGVGVISDPREERWTSVFNIGTELMDDEKRLGRVNKDTECSISPQSS